MVKSYKKSMKNSILTLFNRQAYIAYIFLLFKKFQFETPKHSVKNPLPFLSQLIHEKAFSTLKPFETIAIPIVAPTMLCVPDTGIPKTVAIISQIAQLTKALR